MEGKGILEFGHVVVAALAGFVRGMDTYAEVAAHHEHADVEAQTHAGAEGYVLEKCGGFQLAAGTFGVVFEQPHVAGIEEHCAMYRPEDREAVFKVHLEFECSGLVEVAVDLIAGHAVAAGAEAADGKCADGVGATDVELFAVGHLRGVAVCVGGSYCHAANEPMVASAQPAVVDELCLPFNELGEGGAEQLFLTLFATCLIDRPEDVAGFLDGELPVEGVVGIECSVVDVAERHLRNELTLEALRYGLVGIHDGIEFRSCADEVDIGDLEQGKRVGHMACGSPIVGEGGVELRHVEVVGTVEQIGSEGDARPVELAAAARNEARRSRGKESAVLSPTS